MLAQLLSLLGLARLACECCGSVLDLHDHPATVSGSPARKRWEEFLMSLSPLVRSNLTIALANQGAAKELADAVDAAVGGNPSAAITFTGNDTFSGNCTLSGVNVFTGATNDFKRIKATQGTSLVAGDFALSGGFGNTASVAVKTGSKDTRFGIVVTSAGTGQGASPTITLTFKDGTFTSVPFAVVSRGAGDQPTVPLLAIATATTLVITFLGTPVAAETYTIFGIVLG